MKKTQAAPEGPNKKGVLYSAGQTPPPAVLFFSALQHMLLVLSLGLALPVAVTRAAGLSLGESAVILSASLFSMGLATILQTIRGRFIGSGYQSFSVSDSAALSACLMAAQLGGIPLVLGMTVLSGVLKFVLGSFTYRLRKMFPPEVTGTMIFILGISIIPTCLKYFFGTAKFAETGAYNIAHLGVALATFLFMLCCSLFIKKLKPYSVLLGIVFGFLLSWVTGVFDTGALANLSETPVVGLPLRLPFAFSFDARVLVPFLIVTIAAVVDNIGDYSATQSANDAKFVHPNWKSVENGIRGSALGSVLAGLMGGPIQSTATSNIGIAGATGITSRKTAYAGSAMLILIAFFPMLSGVLSVIPEPVLGAVLLFSICYIMAGGFSALSSRALDDRRIFVVFLSVIFAVSTLIPNLYAFLPQAVSDVLVSPMVMGIAVLISMTLLCKIGTKKKFEFVSGVGSGEIPELNKSIYRVCTEWAASRAVAQKLQIGVDALCESFAEINPAMELRFQVVYDELQIKLGLTAEDAGLKESFAGGAEDEGTTFGVTVLMLQNMFDTVRVKEIPGGIQLNIDADI